MKEIWIPSIVYYWFPRLSGLVGFASLMYPEKMGRILGSSLIIYSVYVMMRRAYSGKLNV